MTDKAKPPQPMAFKNLAELKRYIKLGTEFKATRHKYHPDIVGLTRVVTKVQTNGFYSKIKDEPNHRFSDCNGGKGFFTELGKAGGYIFDGTAVKVLDKRGENGVIYELEFYRENTEVGLYGLTFRWQATYSPIMLQLLMKQTSAIACTTILNL